jgi:acetylornithine/succinyldiaminopimelate/putrescine aminotransferase
LLDAAKRISDLFRDRLTALAQACDIVEEVRIAGLMIGIELAVEGTAIVQACMDRNLLVNCTQGTVIRLLPAMTLTEEQANQGCDILTEVLQEAAARAQGTAEEA